MSMKSPTPEQLEQQLQEAEAEHDRVREGNRELQENFCPISLGDWLNLCRRAEVPHVPATQVTEVLRDDYLAFDTEGEPSARLQFIQFFTRQGQSVLDPFAGTGTTLLAAQRLGRQAQGIELEPAFVEFSEQHQEITIQTGDATTLLADRDRHPDETYDYLFTSPPYMNALRKSRGGNKDTRHKKRMSISQPTIYGNNPLDIGNIEDSGQYITRLVQTFSEAHQTLKRGAYCTIIIQNLNFNGSLQPIAWKLALAMLDTELWEMKGERIWCQDRRRLGIYGYPSAYATNNYHHYCLTFRKPK